MNLDIAELSIEKFYYEFFEDGEVPAVDIQAITRNLRHLQKLTIKRVFTCGEKFFDRSSGRTAWS